MDRTSLLGRTVNVFVGGLSLFAASFAAPPALRAAEAAAPLERVEAQPGEKFLRYVADADRPRLETSIVSYRNEQGAQVDLIGAVHIGDASYYDALNRAFKSYDVVLYEMVKPSDVQPGKPGVAAAAKRRGASLNWVHTLQRMMQENLDLEFQLDKVDYTAANFVHADLDSDTFLAMQKKRGESMMTLMLESMLRELSNPTEPSANAPGIMDIIDALSSPDRSRQLKIVLARQFSDMDRALGAMEGSVIIDERNHHALKVLKAQIDGGKKKIGVFYGAGHFAGMEKQMVDLMGFKQVGEPRWITAWDLSEGGPKAPANEAPATEPAAR